MVNRQHDSSKIGDAGRGYCLIIQGRLGSSDIWGNLLGKSKL